jgi:hypothetical protein
MRPFERNYTDVRFEVSTAVVMKSIIFWDVTPCSLLGCHLLTSWSLPKLFSSTLKIEAICFSETSAVTQQTTRRHIPEDDTIQTTHKLEDNIEDTVKDTGHKIVDSVYLVKGGNQWWNLVASVRILQVP